MNTLENNFSTQEVKEPDWFHVSILAIPRSMFCEPRVDCAQEDLRQIILEAISEVEKNPIRYPASFKLLIPKKSWRMISGREMRALEHFKLGKIIKDENCHMADWVEWALGLAQRIVNGESWTKVCNEFDTELACRAIIWKGEGKIRIVGGAIKYSVRSAPSCVQPVEHTNGTRFSYVVPLIACKDED